MNLFKVSSSRLRGVYGLPTIRGLILAALLGWALWLSIAQYSETERWIFLLMILFLLVHLTDVSQPFRHLQLILLPFDPPFAGAPAAIPIQITNLVGVPLKVLYFRFENTSPWIEVGPVPGHTSLVAWVPCPFPFPGQQALPRLTVKSIPTPKLFRFWRVCKFSELSFILPKPVDHHVLAHPAPDPQLDDELTGVEQILDPRHFAQTDQKLLLKTGIAYRRIYRSGRAGEEIELAWNRLKELPPRERAEQFSYWIKIFSEAKGETDFSVSVNTPFSVDRGAKNSMNWRRLKNLFGEWLHANT